VARLTADQWRSARQSWEADPALTFEGLAERLGLSRQAVSKKAKGDQWAKVGALREVAERAQLKADRKVAGVAGATAKKGEDATFEASVEIRADVIERHRADWSEHRKLFPLADIKAKFELGKSAKITAEMMAIRQKAERAAYGLEEGGANPPGGDLVKTLGELIEKLPG
jgi:transcriptional regulator with XRE-family HTH domain